MAQVQKIHRNTTASSSSGASFQFKPKNPSGFYQPELLLDRKLILADLRKTTLITLLAVGLQIALYVYLQRGGWNTILTMFR